MFNLYKSFYGCLAQAKPICFVLSIFHCEAYSIWFNACNERRAHLVCLIVLQRVSNLSISHCERSVTTNKKIFASLVICTMCRACALSNAQIFRSHSTAHLSIWTRIGFAVAHKATHNRKRQRKYMLILLLYVSSISRTNDNMFGGWYDALSWPFECAVEMVRW